MKIYDAPEIATGDSLNLVTVARLERNPTVKTEIERSGCSE